MDSPTQRFDGLLKKASELHNDGKFSEAEPMYRSILRECPKHPDALHQLGALLVQQHGEHQAEEARSLIQQAINLVPSCAKYRNSLGIVLEKAGRVKEAVEAFERANEKDPMNLQILCNLARALKTANRPTRCAEVWRAVVALQPQHPSAYYKMGGALKSIGRHQQALAAYRAHLRLYPDDEMSAFWVAALSGDVAAMKHSPAALVAGLFDQYADHFDEHLVTQLQYRTPQALMEALQTSLSAGTSPSWQHCVDLGCGTGLMGPLLRSKVAALDGVDLSPKMVEQAKRRGCYDRLEVGDLVTFLTDAKASRNGAAVQRISQDGVFDLFVSADVFVYIGDLKPVMQAAREVAIHGAMFAFSTESMEAEGLEAPETPPAQGERGEPKEFQTVPRSMRGNAGDNSDTPPVGGPLVNGRPRRMRRKSSSNIPAPFQNNPNPDNSPLNGTSPPPATSQNCGFEHDLQSKDDSGRSARSTANGGLLPTNSAPEHDLRSKDDSGRSARSTANGGLLPTNSAPECGATNFAALKSRWSGCDVRVNEDLGPKSDSVMTRPSFISEPADLYLRTAKSGGGVDDCVPVIKGMGARSESLGSVRLLIARFESCLSRNDSATISNHSSSSQAEECGQQGDNGEDAVAREGGGASRLGYILKPTGRYAHSEGYLRRVAEDCGWQVLFVKQEIIRYNVGKPIHGHLVVMKLGEGG